MKKILLLLSACLFLKANANLLQNGDFNEEELLTDIMIQQDDGKVKVTKVTENLSWNQCIKMEIAGFKETEGRQQISAGLLFGRNGKNCGVPVKANAFYDFSLELKGNRGVSFGFDAIQITREGEHLGGGAASVSMFDDLPDTDKAASEDIFAGL